jgi:hypothetical protein
LDEERNDMAHNQTRTSVELRTGSHCYTGLVATEGYRLADALNDASSDLLELEDVSVRALGTDSQGQHSPQLHLKKSAILLAIPKGTYEAPVRRIGAHVRKPKYPVIATLPGCVVSGQLSLSGQVGLLTVIGANSTLPRFIAVTDAKIDSSHTGEPPLSCDTVIVQRERIEAMHLSARSGSS